MRSVLATLFWICHRFASSIFHRFADVCFVKHMFAHKSKTYVLIFWILLETQVMRNVGSCHRNNWRTLKANGLARIGTKVKLNSFFLRWGNSTLL